MKTTQRLLQAALPIWESYYTHPFVSGIGDGSLPVEKFQFYMIQDHKYLMQYAKVFALGVVKSTAEADMRLFADLITANAGYGKRRSSKLSAETGHYQTDDR